MTTAPGAPESSFSAQQGAQDGDAGRIYILVSGLRTAEERDAEIRRWEAEGWHVSSAPDRLYGSQWMSK